MDQKECTHCGQLADRVVSTASLAFRTDIAEATPQNTGFSAIDHSVDRVIGLDAEKKWATIRRREAGKREVLRGTGATKNDLSREPDGSYRVMAPGERRASETARSLHQKALKQIPRHILIGAVINTEE